ncbi:MAG: DeoR family transcriptional regulator [Patescibacteria group bacterium]
MTDINIETLTNKLYQVTDRMDDQDSLKWKLRSSALEISEVMFHDTHEMSFSAEEENTKRKAFLFENIIFLLGLASSQFHIARSNFETLQREYRSVFSIKSNLKIEQITSENNKKTEILEKEITPEPFVRQNKIMNYLNERHVASIGELVVFFESSVSDKTLQRDLGELVAQGKVRADGEKRWRVYSLSNA